MNLIKFEYTIRTIAFALTAFAISFVEGSGHEPPPGHKLESRLSFGDSKEKVGKVLDTSGIKHGIIYSLGLSPEALREMGSDALDKYEMVFEKFSIKIDETPMIILGFNSNARLISHCKILYGDKRLFGVSIARALDGSRSENSRQQGNTSSSGKSDEQSKPTSRGNTIGEAIARVTQNLKFGDTVDDALRILNDCGVAARTRILSFMTEDELKDIGSDLSEEQKSAFYYEIDVEAELGIRLAFDYNKHLVQFRHVCRGGSESNGQTIEKVEEARNSGLIGKTDPNEKMTDETSAPDNRSSAPLRPQEGPPPAKL